jgi:Ferredoxin
MEEIIVKTLAELQQLRDDMQRKMNLRKTDEGDVRVVVGMATCGIAAGARPVLAALVDEVGKRNLKNVVVTQTGCVGVCRLEPIFEVYQPGREKVTYVKMTAEKALKVVSEHLVNGRVVDEYTIGAAD